MASSTSEPLTIMSRIDRMEKHEHFMKRLLMGLLFGIVAAVVLFLSVAKGPDVVQAREFVLQDENGNPRAIWTITGNGESGIHLLDQKGTARASLSVNSEGSPALALTDHDEKYVAAMVVTEQGPALALYDPDGKPIFIKP